MTRLEFEEWREYYRLYPFDDFHRFHRPAALVANSMSGGSMKDKLEWLQPDPAYAGLPEADIRTYQALGLKPPVRH
jgi:hypothetical protein